MNNSRVLSRSGAVLPTRCRNPVQQRAINDFNEANSHDHVHDEPVVGTPLDRGDPIDMLLPTRQILVLCDTVLVPLCQISKHGFLGFRGRRLAAISGRRTTGQLAFFALWCSRGRGAFRVLGSGGFPLGLCGRVGCGSTSFFVPVFLDDFRGSAVGGEGSAVGYGDGSWEGRTNLVPASNCCAPDHSQPMRSSLTKRKHDVSFSFRGFVSESRLRTSILALKVLGRQVTEAVPAREYYDGIGETRQMLTFLSS